MTNNIKQLLIVLFFAISGIFGIGIKEWMNEIWEFTKVKGTFDKQKMRDWFCESKYAVFTHWELATMPE
ncbi:MAG TPA: hypothetical protein VFC65_05980 [Prolixibacteraceae bacterium]|nr:hypothetical protein [Prolixibacteraceae bacterium]